MLLFLFSGILFSISLHAYKFLRNSGYLIVPHPKTIQKMCSAYKSDPQREQSEVSILAHMREQFKRLHESEYVVSLMVDGD